MFVFSAKLSFGLIFLLQRKNTSNTTIPHVVSIQKRPNPPPPIIPIQQVQMQDVVRELEKQRLQAQIESKQLREQLASQSISVSQMEAMKQ